jgi:Icc-related predicted phosphoesterase
VTRLLAFSDLHCDLGQAERLVARSAEAEVVAGVGDFASVHRGLEETIAALRGIEKPVLLVPGNNETDEALRAAVGEWATVLHGEAAEVDSVSFFGLGAGVPTTPWDWSFDLTEEEAEAKLAACPEGAVMLTHSPPKGHVDKGLGSEAVLRAVEAKRPQVVLCGHIHELWGQESAVGGTPVHNLGPKGAVVEVVQG